MDVIDYKKEYVDINISDNYINPVENRPEVEQELSRLQMLYLQYRNIDEIKSEKIWKKMFELVSIYTESFIKQRLKKKFLSKEELQDRVHGATLAFMRQYKEKSSFYVENSFSGLIVPKVLEALYKHKNDDLTISLDYKLNDNFTIQDFIASKEKFKIFDNNDYYELKMLLREFDEVVPNRLQQMLLRFYLFIYLMKPKTKHAKLMFSKCFLNDYKTKKIIEYFMLELHNRLEQSSNSQNY